MKQLSRRNLIRLLASASAILPASLVLAAPTGLPKPVEFTRALGPFLDTLLPDDETPGATRLGVDRAILERMGASGRLAKLVVLGCVWLDQQAREAGAGEFAALQAQGRESIVTAAENSAARSLPRMFFIAVQQLAFHYYYAHPGSWHALGYTGPPQPVGFPGHDGPVEECRP